MTSSSVEEQFDDLRRAVGRARAAIADGAPVELSGLEIEVTRVTEAARNVPLTERPSVLAAMAAMRYELDELEIDVRRQHDAALAQHAVGAYGANRGTT